MKRTIALILAAVMMVSVLSGCVVKTYDDYTPDADYETTTKKPVTINPEISITVKLETTKKPETTKAPETTTKKPETTVAPKPTADDISKELTTALAGVKLTDAKEYLIGCGILEAKISMFTSDGDSLDNFYNVPSCYDTIKIVYTSSGTISIYGKKMRVVPDALKDFFKDATREAALQKVVDKIKNL